MEFDILKIGTWSSVTSVFVGDTINFEVTIWAPVSKTKLVMELYTYSDLGAVMTICKPNIHHMGSHLEGPGPNDVDVIVESTMSAERVSVICVTDMT